MQQNKNKQQKHSKTQNTQNETHTKHKNQKKKTHTKERNENETNKYIILMKKTNENKKQQQTQ